MGYASIVQSNRRKPASKVSRPPEAKAPTDKRTIFLVDDHAVVRDGIRSVLKNHNDLMLIGEAENARNAFAKLETTEPDLVVVDISLPGANGIEFIKSLKARFPDLPVMVLSMHDEALYAERALRAGARGYIMKQESADQLLSAIRTVLRGEVYVSANLSSLILKSMVSRKEPNVNSIDQLSDRELEIFKLLGGGFTTREIAKNLGISGKTVESHRGNIRQKLKVNNGAELLRLALANRDEPT